MKNEYKLSNERISDLAVWCNDNELSFQSSQDLNDIMNKITDEVNIRETTTDNVVIRDISKVFERTELELNGNDDGRFLNNEEIYSMRMREIAMIVKMYYGTD